MKTNIIKRKPFPRVGGKTQLVKELLKHIPEHTTYVEPFAGGATLFFNLNTIGKHTVLNDLDADVYATFNLFKNTDGKDIADAIRGDISREQFFELVKQEPTTEYERAIRYLKLSKISFRSSLRSYSYKKRLAKINYNNKYKDKLKDTVILNTDYKHAIHHYDSPSTFFYLDPPYDPKTTSEKTYKHNSFDPEELCVVLKGISGKFLLSYNDCPKVRELFKDFTVMEVQTKYAGKGGTNQIRTELLIKNF